MASELEGLRKQLDIQIQRLNALREQYAIINDPNQKFTLEFQISEIETSNTELQKKIAQSYGIATVDAKTLLEQRIKDLNLEIDGNIGEYYLVNCDRKPPRDNFWEAFDEFSEQHNPFQFYFIVACPTQQPNSFAERMIYEVVIEELEEEFGAINYVRHPTTHRVKIEDLPLGRNLAKSQKEFKKYFARRFNITDTETAFEGYLRSGLPKLEYQYVSTVFEISASDWDDSLIQTYLQWIIQVFSNTPKEVPTFQFFFAIFLRDAHVKPLAAPSQKIIDSLKEVIHKNSGYCTLITQLMPVTTELIEKWIRDLGEYNQSKIDDLIKLLIHALPEDKKAKFDKINALDMSDIERFQEMIYKVINKN